MYQEITAACPAAVAQPGGRGSRCPNARRPDRSAAAGRLTYSSMRTACGTLRHMERPHDTGGLLYAFSLTALQI